MGDRNSIVASMKNIFLLVLLLCVAFKNAAQISISPVFGDKPISEDTWFVTKNGDSVQFENIRFYLSNIQFETIDNQLVRDMENAHLVDVFEPTTWEIDFKNIDFKIIKMLHFNIGIDSLTNVSGALSGDLDPQKGMYWAWQSGYINLKIEGRSPQSKNRKNVFQYHIGGYLQPFYSMKHVELPILAVYTEGVSDVGKTPKSDISNPKYTEGVVLKIDVSKFFENIQIATQNSIMIPCKEAMQLADYSVKMFSIAVYEK
jgi:hypothetical protein